MYLEIFNPLSVAEIKLLSMSGIGWYVLLGAKNKKVFIVLINDLWYRAKLNSLCANTRMLMVEFKFKVCKDKGLINVKL